MQWVESENTISISIIYFQLKLQIVFKRECYILIDLDVFENRHFPITSPHTFMAIVTPLEKHNTITLW